MTVPGDPYSPAVRALFAQPRHAGRLDPARRASAQGQGVVVELSMQEAGATIRALRFLAYGCPHLIAAAERFCRDYEARPVSELRQFTAVELIRSLPVPIEKTGRILVLEDAVRSLGA